MTRALLRTNFNSSRLIRFLADLSVEDSVESGQTFAEKLGQWLGVADAIKLHAAHSVGAVNPSAARCGGLSGASLAVKDEFDEFVRIRTALTNSITRSCSPDVFDARITWPMPKSGIAIEVSEAKEPAAVYEPYHRFYLAHQHDMDSSLRPLRTRVRAALSKASPALRQLAALDAALDQILSDREGKLLATVPALLEKRFRQRFEAHRQTLVDTRQADDPAQWMQPAGWLAGFRKELQFVLLAELDVRLQPAMGLIEAFSNEANEPNE